MMDRMDLNRKIDGWLAEHQGELLQFLSSLVQIPSDVTPPYGNELACQRYVAEAYRQAGAEVDIFTPEEVPGLRKHPAFFGTWDGLPRTFEDRPDVVGIFRGGGGGKSLLISTHVDTVPVQPELWKEASPFSGEIKDGRLYGRGSWDTKWGIAAGLYAMCCVRALGIQPRGDVLLESVVDEEFGGSHGTLAARLCGYNADMAINCEPTNMVVAPAHRGGTAWRITVKGDAGMAFEGRRMENSVYKLARVIEAVRAFDIYRNKEIQPVRYFEADPALPSYTLQVGGGGDSYAEAEGIPAECYLVIWVEEHPGTDFDTHRERLTGFINRTLAKDPDFDGVFPEYTHLIRYLPGSSIDSGHPFFNSLEEAFNSASCPYQVAGAPFACDTYVFNLHSPTPAITLGPRGANAHAGDEYVLVEDVTNLTRIFARTILGWCG
jgi:acetylornithine deacetylase